MPNVPVLWCQVRLLCHVVRIGTRRGLLQVAAQATTLKTLSTALAAHLDPWEWSPPHINDPGTSQNLGDRWSDENYRTFRTRFAGYTQRSSMPTTP